MSSHSKIFTFACPTNSFWSLMALASSTATGDFKLNPSMRLKTKTGAQCPRPVCEGASPSLFSRQTKDRAQGLAAAWKQGAPLSPDSQQAETSAHTAVLLLLAPGARQQQSHKLRLFSKSQHLAQAQCVQHKAPWASRDCLNLLESAGTQSASKDPDAPNELF